MSTAKQALNDVSIPDQLKQAHDYCKRRGWEIVRENVEAGASGRSDRHPAFKQMIKDACIDPSPYDIALVHSFSRFYRDAIEQGLYRRKVENWPVRAPIHTVSETPPADRMRPPSSRLALNIRRQEEDRAGPRRGEKQSVRNVCL